MVRAGGYIVLNLKAYAESTGKEAVRLAKIADEASREMGVKVIVCAQATDLAAVSSSVKIPVFAQHVDAKKPGAFTGSIIPEAVKAAGANGTLINHSERKLPLEVVGATVARCKEAGLLSMVCAATVDECAAVAKFGPDFIAIEPPELIGSGISVSTANPDIVRNSVAAVRKVANISVLCGAGISTGADIKKAMELGAAGVLLASAYAKAKDPKKLLIEMARNV